MISGFWYAHVDPVVALLVVDSRVKHRDLTRIDGNETQDSAEKCAFAGSIRADNAGERSGG